MPARPLRHAVIALPEGVPVEQLVQRTLQGDRAAESLLYRRYAPGMLLTIARLLQSLHAAEDVVQDGFIIAFERLGQLQDPAQFRAWLTSIGISLVRRRLRRERVLSFVGISTVGEFTLEAQANPGTSMEARGELALLDQTLRELPSEHRVAWALRYVEGEKLEDVAVLMKKSLATTKRYIFAAEQRIRARVSLEPGGMESPS